MGRAGEPMAGESSAISAPRAWSRVIWCLVWVFD
jgi:hypothetical protein